MEWNIERPFFRAAAEGRHRWNTRCVVGNLVADFFQRGFLPFGSRQVYSRPTTKVKLRMSEEEQ
jgi:hypothetical protein